MYVRVMQRAWQAWGATVTRARQAVTDTAAARLRAQLGQMQRLLKETNRMVGGARMRAVLLALAGRVQCHGFRRWRDWVVERRVEERMDSEVALRLLERTMRRREEGRVARALQQWRRAAAERALELQREQVCLCVCLCVSLRVCVSIRLRMCLCVRQYVSVC